MFVPVSWLFDFVSGRQIGALEIASRLETSGFEVEGLLQMGVPDEGGNHGTIVIGRVLEFSRHPNADRLRVCLVDTGDSELRQIVCGASNFMEGDLVIVALPGAVLPHARAPLKEALLRGEVSSGMMVSWSELGLSGDHDGIVVVPGCPTIEVGSLVRDHLQLSESVFDISVESNRGDCLSVYGIAREVAVLFGLELGEFPGVEPRVGSSPASDLVTIGVSSPARCSRFAVREFINVSIAESPLRAQQRLLASGIRPISNVVDVTNYVMHELGNPLHVYDRDKISGGIMDVRMASEGETIRTLDDKVRNLSTDTLVVSDRDGPCSIAGVMGGVASEVTPSTSRVLLEAASFDRGGIQRTTRSLGLRSESSNRSEKGTSPHLVPIALRRASELIVAWSGATTLGAPQDVVVDLPRSEVVTLRRSRVEEILGMKVEPEESERILEGLGYSPVSAGDVWHCAVPWWRWLDTTREIDLVEEIARIHGLRYVPRVLPRIFPGNGGLTLGQQVRRRVEDHLAGAGLREIVTSSFSDPVERGRFGLEGATPVTLRNPVAADLTELRVSLVPSLLNVLLRNRAVGLAEVQAFELGRVYRVGSDSEPVETDRLGILLSGQFGGEQWTGRGHPADFYTMAAVVDALFTRLGIRIRRERESRNSLLHPGRAARVIADEIDLGVFGEIHPAIAHDLELEEATTVAEFDLQAITDAIPGDASLVELSSFPTIRQDIALIVPTAVEAASLVQSVQDIAGDLVASATVFDVFIDEERFGADRASIGIRVAYQADDRTLTQMEVDRISHDIVSHLSETYGAQLRA